MKIPKISKRLFTLTLASAGLLAMGVAQAQTLLLGPEPIIGAQTVRLVTQGTPVRELLVRTDGIRPFKVEAPDTAGPR